MDAGAGTLDRLLEAAAGRWPARPAVDSPSGALSYAQFDAAVSTAAAALIAAGASPGDRVAFALAHDLALYAAPFVCSRVGVTGLLLDTSLPPDAWARQLERARPRMLVADGGHAERLRRASRGAPVRTARHTLPLHTAAPVTDLPEVAADTDRTVILVTTSGTTGDPTMVRLTSRGLLHVGRAYLDLLDLGEDERSLVVMPLSHIGALSTQTMTMPLVGGCNVLPSTTRPGGALRRMAEQRITLLDAAPAWLSMLLREPVTHVPTWRTLVYGGAPMPAETVHRLASDHPAVSMFDVWGLSEAHGPVTALRYDRARPRPPGSVGWPLAGLRVRAVDGDAPLPAGCEGELCVAGPTVGAGTLDDPGGGLRDGWLPTGDVGFVAADGSVTMTGRSKDLILRGGFNISAREVEQVLRGAAGVVDAAAVAVADGLGGEAVAAVVVVDSAGGASDAALRRLVAERIGRHAVPRRITRIEELPRTPTGKVDRPAVRALFP